MTNRRVEARASAQQLELAANILYIHYLIWFLRNPFPSSTALTCNPAISVAFSARRNRAAVVDNREILLRQIQATERIQYGNSGVSYHKLGGLERLYEKNCHSVAQAALLATLALIQHSPTR
jgi:hypothetical protein